MSQLTLNSFKKQALIVINKLSLLSFPNIYELATENDFILVNDFLRCRKILKSSYELKITRPQLHKTVVSSSKAGFRSIILFSEVEKHRSFSRVNVTLKEEMAYVKRIYGFSSLLRGLGK